MNIVEKKKATAALAVYANKIDSGPLVLTDKGRPIAVLLAIENADLETISLSSNPKIVDLIERSRARAVKKGGISSDEMRRRVG